MHPKRASKFLILTVLDGWGIAPDSYGNAIARASTPNFDKLMVQFPHTELGASGDSVGLPRGEVGNTETGHLNLGAGRIVYQDLARINMAIADGTFFTNKCFLDAIRHVKEFKSNLHLMGLVGSGGVHSNIEHLYALVRLAAQNGVKNVFIHAFTDGRDSPPNASLTYIRQLREVLAKEQVGQIASVMGRYWAMDRDRRWDRTAKAYFALTKGVGHLVKTPEEAVEDSYKRGQTDEFIEPSIVSSAGGVPIGLIKENDSVVFFNFRIDRPRQLTNAFVADVVMNEDDTWEYDRFRDGNGIQLPPPPEPGKIAFDRGPKIKNLYFCAMTEYGKKLTAAGAIPAFPPEHIDMPLGGVISSKELTQLRAAESEKERFVTFYFDGQREVPFPGEDKLIVPSPHVPTYDKIPEMSAIQLTDALIKQMSLSLHSFYLINFANADMVGHTGNLEAAITACGALDACIGRLVEFVKSHDGSMILTADHGNAEEMISHKTGEPDTDHTANPVPFIAIDKAYDGNPQVLPKGILADVAPSALYLMGIDQPSSMTGRNLLTDLAR